MSFPAPNIVETGSGLASSGCLPASGSVFPVDTTIVLCTARDVAGNTGTATFSVTVTPASLPTTPDGRMYGVGHVDSASKHHHFVFRVSEFGDRDYGRFEYWVKGTRLCLRDDDDYDRDREHDGRHDHDYDRDHRKPTGRFRATSITSVTFADNPGFKPSQGHRTAGSGIDSVTFDGTGEWNGRRGFTFEVIATDRGEPGRHRDTFALTVRDMKGAVVARVSSDLDGGNIQSERVGRAAPARGR